MEQNGTRWYTKVTLIHTFLYTPTAVPHLGYYPIKLSFYILHILCGILIMLLLCESFTTTLSPAPNSGIVLWVQQFCAIFLKRVYNSLRFWAALISQLFLPMIFVLLALSFALTLPDPNEGDPSRVLTIENSGLSRDINLFYSLSTDISGIDFSVSDT